VTRFLFCFAICLCAEPFTAKGLQKPVEILRDKWGVPHIYASNADDLFFAQGWMAAKDRLFQLDLWRRVGTGKLAEVMGPPAVARDRIARLVQYRGDWNAEWASYSPDAKAIATAFTRGINAYIESLGGKRPVEFRAAGYDPGLWTPEDVTARIAGLAMIRNVAREVARAQDIKKFGLDTVQRLLPPDPAIRIEIPKELDLDGITPALLKDYTDATGTARFTDPVDLNSIGSNNWVMAGSKTVTGKPLLANDPHRPIQNPSLRKTVHLVAPGWNVIGAGEPALPGIALGHNEEVGFGFTIVGIDQGDLYVEKVDPSDASRYMYKGAWRKFDVVVEEIRVKGEPKPRRVELRYSVHGPVIADDAARQRAYALKWVGSEPGAAGYLAALRLSRSKNWDEFQRNAGYYKLPSENLVYADRAGNIGWIAAGWAPLRKNWSGLLPVPGHTGEYEWSGFLAPELNPRKYNPAEGFVATANHNILPPGYKHQLAFEWAAPWRFSRISEMIAAQRKFSIADFQRMQLDVRSHAARKMQAVVKAWAATGLTPREKGMVDRFLRWDGGMSVESQEALLYALWSSKLSAAAYGPELGPRVELVALFDDLTKNPKPAALLAALREAIADAEQRFGKDESKWQWGALHQVRFQHPVNVAKWHLGPVARPGDANTVGAASGTNFQQTAGASYRQILDVSDWDKSVTTNTPGESGDPNSPFYSNLLREWASGGYHPLLYSRAAVEANTAERILLTPPVQRDQ
jgi:penicillin amidase